MQRVTLLENPRKGMGEIVINVEQDENDEYRQVRRKYHLFVGYSSNDEEDVRKLCNELENKMKLKCMIATRDFHSGVPVLENCTLRMQESEKVLLIITPSFLESSYCKLEAYQALMASSLGQRGKVIPVLFKPVEVEIPDYLSMYTYIDATKVDDLPSKIFEAFHNPVIVDGVRRKIKKERPLTREEIQRQNGARLLVTQSCRLNSGFRGTSHHFPPLEKDEIIDEVREYYDNLRQQLNTSRMMRWHELLFCSNKHCLLVFTPLLVGILFLVLMTRMFIVIDHKYELKYGEIAAVVLLSLLFATLSICLPITFWCCGKKKLREISETVWNDSMKNIKKNRFVVIMELESTLKLHFVRYDITDCEKYIFELLKTKYPDRSNIYQQSEAERMVKKAICLSRHFLVDWEVWQENMEDNRHNTWLDRPCACEIIVKYWENRK